MESRRKRAKGAAPGGLDRSGISATAPGIIASPAAQSFAQIDAVIAAGGQIMLGTLVPVNGVAIAHDGKKTLVMLKRRAMESVPALLSRLEGAIAKARTTGIRVDEVNAADSTEQYEVANPGFGRSGHAAKK